MDYKKTTKNDLIEFAVRHYGLDIPRKALKSDIVAMLKSAQRANPLPADKTAIDIFCAVNSLKIPNLRFTVDDNGVFTATRNGKTMSGNTNQPLRNIIMSVTML